MDYDTEMDYTEIPNQKMYIRSASEQPSPYSSRQRFGSPMRSKSPGRPKSPGRSLTAIYTKGASKVSSCVDTELSHRRRTVQPLTTSRAISYLRDQEECGDRLLRSASVPKFDESIVSGSFFNKDVTESSFFNDKEISSTHGVEELEIKYKNSALLAEQHMSIVKGSKAKVIRQNTSMCSVVCNFIGKILNICLTVFLFLLTIFLLFFAVKSYQNLMDEQCRSERSMEFPLSKLHKNLSATLFGQDLAVQLLVSSIKSSNDVEIPKILWFLGWTGTGKSHSIRIITKVLKNVAHIEMVVPSLHLKRSEEVNSVAISLYLKLQNCQRNIVVIDGCDEEQNFGFDLLLSLDKMLRDDIIRGAPKGNTIFIISGIYGSQDINSKYLDLRFSGRSRAELQLSNFQDEFEDLLRKDIFQTVAHKIEMIPFLPLEKDHVKQCIVQIYTALKNENTTPNNIENKYFMDVKIIQQVLDQIKFIPTAQPLLSGTGCKRIYGFLKLVLAEAQSEKLTKNKYIL